MNPPCAKCKKTVYPTEKLNCLDKSWHKGCFNCEACGMTLNMKNYKGYNKVPYCHAHYPTTSFTPVADTPENRRLAKNTKTQSQVEYQKKFVEEKGHKISVADDPETVRARRNTQHQSQVVYSGQQQQRESSEMHRPPAEDATVRMGNIHVRQSDLLNAQKPVQLPVAVTQSRLPALSPDSYDPVRQFESAYSGPNQKQSVGSIFQSAPTMGYWHKGCFRCETCNLGLTMKNYKGYDKRPYCNTHYPTTKFTAVADTPENLRLKKQTANQSQLEYQKQHRENLAKFTAVSDDPESLRLKKASSQASHVAYKATAPPPVGAPSSNPGQAPQQYDPPPQQAQFQPQRNDPYSQPAQPPPMAQPAPPPPAPQSSGPLYVALYDYAAADDDEVSFIEGDIIMNAEIIDQGWMSGTVQRTGETGMLPSNYVEPQ